MIDRIITERVQTAHLLRCIVQGHVGKPCKYCGIEWQEPAKVHGCAPLQAIKSELE